MSQYLETWFPRLRSGVWVETSPRTIDYNCIGWAASDDQHWWEPDPMLLHYWPDGVSRAYTLQAYISAFISIGYAPCSGDEPEPGFEKVAIFVLDGRRPSHAARQLETGEWTSKVGDYKDITHALEDLEGTEYGKVNTYLQRPRPTHNG